MSNTEVKSVRVARLGETINEFRNAKVADSVIYELKRLQVEYGNVAVVRKGGLPAADAWPELGLDARGRKVVFI